MEYQQNGEKDTPARDSNHAPSAYRTDALPLYQKGYLTLRFTDIPRWAKPIHRADITRDGQSGPGPGTKIFFLTGTGTRTEILF